MADHVLPTPRQLEFHNWELGLFLHFGVRTFNEGHLDWDDKPMSAASFMPTQAGRLFFLKELAGPLVAECN